jgi:hypothetical protein
MGIIAKTLAAPSAYALKQTDFWSDLTDQVAGALCDADLIVIEVWAEAHPIAMPFGWYGELAELIEKRREELADEDIRSILLDRFDFS